nr:E3 ubiquitin-protein ligase RNF168-like isoform X1 [Procambarus clarkii]
MVWVASHNKVAQLLLFWRAVSAVMASHAAEADAKPSTPGKLSLEDVRCPICLDILMEPVTMPCRHSVCMPCFNQHVAHSALACPICRRRISVWVRRAAKAKKLINTRLWQNIQNSFAAKVEARLHGLEDSDTEEINVPVHHLSAPGEIRQEYETLLAQEHRDEIERRTEEEWASNKLIQELQNSEKMRLRERRKEQELLAENDIAVAQHIKETEMMLLEERLKQFQQLCANDEALARHIEEAEQKERQRRLKPVGKGLATNPKKPATPPRGPMDVYIGQKTPRFYGKLIVPEVPCSTPDGSLTTSDKIKTSVKISQDFNTPSTSMSRPGNSSTSSSKSDTMCIVPNSASDSLDCRMGRELREITSSQSSESEPEDLVSPSQTNILRRPVTSGKENMQERRKNSPCKLGKGKGTFSANRRNQNDQYSPDIDSYSGVIGVTDNGIHISRKVENGEDVDIEEFICAQTPTKTKERNNVKVCKGLVRGDHNSKSCASETGGSDDEQIVTASEAHDIPQCNQSSELDPQTDLTSIFSDREGTSESLESLIAEQRQLEARLEQEVKDHLLAESLQKEFDQQRRVVNRSRGSEDEYKLRRRKNSSHKVPSISAGNSSQVKGRQPTLMESIAKRHRTV